MSDHRNSNNMTKHILPTSANLLGICFAILSFIKLSKLGAETIIDEICAMNILIFLAASVLSYASIRSKRKGELYERLADIIFLIGLSLLALLSLIIVFEIVP